MEIKEFKRKDETLVATLSGRMDAMTSTGFTDQMGVWTETGLKSFIIDCSALDYISSAGLRAILVTAKKIKTINGSLQLAALQENVHNVFSISGFDKIIPITATLDDALNQ